MWSPSARPPLGTAPTTSSLGKILGWGWHHVNLPAGNVREAIAFYSDIAGLPEGRWRAPASRGNFSIDPVEGDPSSGQFNRGLHIIRPDAGFAHRNNFAHNPSIGGHPAIFVKDVKAVKVAPGSGRRPGFRRRRLCHGRHAPDLRPRSLVEHDRGEPVRMSAAHRSKNPRRQDPTRDEQRRQGGAVDRRKLAQPWPVRIAQTMAAAI